jgi:hypothetical protein
MVWAVGFAMMRGMHETMVTDILVAVKIKVASIGTMAMCMFFLSFNPNQLLNLIFGSVKS